MLPRTKMRKLTKVRTMIERYIGAGIFWACKNRLHWELRGEPLVSTRLVSLR